MFLFFYRLHSYQSRLRYHEFRNLFEIVAAVQDAKPWRAGQRNIPSTALGLVDGETATTRRVQMVGGVPVKEQFALFPKKPGKKMAYIAGLPKPRGCV